MHEVKIPLSEVEFPLNHELYGGHGHGVRDLCGLRRCGCCSGTIAIASTETSVFSLVENLATAPFTYLLVEMSITHMADRTLYVAAVTRRTK